MEQPVGTCSICGGEVMCHVGVWHGTIPPRPHCTSCGAVAATGQVIPMRPVLPQLPQRVRIPRLAVEFDRPVTFEPWTAYDEHQRPPLHAIGVWCPA